MMYQSTKTYGHEVGLSCTFRQYGAESHCQYLHGYALSVKLTFAAFDLDERNWVVDFGSLKPIKAWLASTFDHTTLIAEDDPQRRAFAIMHEQGLIQLRIVPKVGCEGFAEYISQHILLWLKDQRLSPRVWLVSVEVREHGANSALYFPGMPQEAE